MNAGNNVIKTIIISFALFASFFGAGNLTLPSAIGLMAGREWGWALLGFTMSVALLPFLSFVAVARAGGTEEGIASGMGRAFSIFFTSVMILCTSLLVTVPRTAAVVHELGAVTIFGPIPQVLTSCIFFAMVICLSLNPSTVVEKVGKYLVPVFVLIMAVVIVKGVFYPIDIPADTGVHRALVLRSAFLDGYQTLNVFGGLVFSGAVFAAIAEHQPYNRRAQAMMVCGVAVLTGLSLFIIYGGLIYLGATGSGLFNIRMGYAAVLAALIDSLLFDGLGLPALIIATIFICSATAVGLTAGVSYFFSRVTDDRLSYRNCVVVFCAISLLISTIEADATTRYAVLILTLIYPATIVLILLNVFRCCLMNRGTFLGAGGSALVVSFLTMLPAAVPVIGAIPLSVHGLAWIVPAVICGILGTIFCKIYERIKA